MLLDEPLSALDLKLRQHMRAELRAIQKRTGVTFIYITHDQGEALTMSDRVGVMSQGVIQQVADPTTIYDKPATPFVASFVGENNPFFGRVTAIGAFGTELDTPIGRLRGSNGQGLRIGDEAVLFVRPERLALVGKSGGNGDANLIETGVSHASFEGSFANIFLHGVDGREIVVNAVNDGTMPDLPSGERVRVSFAAADAVVLPRGDLARE